MINEIKTELTKPRLKDIQQKVKLKPFMWDSGRNATKVAISNNFALEEVLKNQQTIIDNQNKIIRQLAMGNKVNVLS